MIGMKNQLFQNKYRIKSTRLQHWDYSSCGAYYVTICTKDREQFFGEIINGKMKLSRIGEIAEHEWKQTCEIRKNVELDEYVIMPDHMHGILFIVNAFHPVVETCRGMSLQTRTQMYNKFSRPVSQSLSMIINHFKSAVKCWCNKNGFPNFAWQPLFHESIVQDEKHLNAVREYIINNPTKFKLDKNL